MSWSFSFQGLLRDFSSCLPPQYRQRRSPRIRCRYLVGLIDQLAQFGLQEWLVMLPFLWPNRSFLSSSVTPAARSLRPNVCFRSCTRIDAKPVGAARLKRCSDSGPVPRRRGRRSIHLLGCELVETTGVFGLDEKVQPRASHSSP